MSDGKLELVKANPTLKLELSVSSFSAHYTMHTKSNGLTLRLETVLHHEFPSNSIKVVRRATIISDGCIVAEVATPVGISESLFEKNSKLWAEAYAKKNGLRIDKIVKD